MKTKDPALWAALRLHRILDQPSLCRQNDLVPTLQRVLEEQQHMERCWRLYCKARSHGWAYAAARLHHQLVTAIDRVNRASQPIRPARLAHIPTVADIFAEITHLQDDFDHVEIQAREKRISATTDDITLEGIFLGPFKIQLDFEALSERRDASVFIIDAEDANPASSNSSCTHPHVSDERLCAGDATVPMSNALAEGRIGDAFQLVNRVLHTYNAMSAYVALDAWDGQSCSDCDTTTSSDSLYHCDHCGNDFCDGCIRSCERCMESVCFGCSEEIEDGDRLCPKCKKLYDQEREEDPEKEDEIAIDDPVEEQPQPLTEISHANAQDNPDAGHAGLSGGTPERENRSVGADISATQAA